MGAKDESKDDGRVEDMSDVRADSGIRGACAWLRDDGSRFNSEGTLKGSQHSTSSFMLGTQRIQCPLPVLYPPNSR